MKISCIILAAGQAKRMGRNKLLLPFRNKTVLETVLDTLNEAQTTLGTAGGSVRIAECIVVVGHYRLAIRKQLQNRSVQIVDNPRYSEGLSSSVHTGIAACASDAGGVLIALGDMPHTTAALVVRLCQTFVGARYPCIAAPVYQEQTGNPVIFSLPYFRELLMSINGDNGARRLIQQHLDKLNAVAVSSSLLLSDIDTLEAYQKNRGPGAS